MIVTIKTSDSVRWGVMTAVALGAFLGVLVAGWLQTGVLWETPWQ